MVLTLSVTTPYAFQSGQARRCAGGSVDPSYTHFLSAGAQHGVTVLTGAGLVAPTGPVADAVLGLRPSFFGSGAAPAKRAHQLIQVSRVLPSDDAFFASGKCDLVCMIVRFDL
jgi:hypothetical protein